MRTRIFIERKGKAREEHRLETSIPLDFKMLTKWGQISIPKKEYDRWYKDEWNSSSYGERIEGKIHKAGLEENGDVKSFSGPMMAFRSYVVDVTGQKKKLPILLFGRIKKLVKIDYFISQMELTKEQMSIIKDLLKSDVWAPISIWHHEKIDPSDGKSIGILLDFAKKYSAAIFYGDFTKSKWNSFVETELYK